MTKAELVVTEMSGTKHHRWTVKVGCYIFSVLLIACLLESLLYATTITDILTNNMIKRLTTFAAIVSHTAVNVTSAVLEDASHSGLGRTFVTETQSTTVLVDQEYISRNGNKSPNISGKIDLKTTTTATTNATTTSLNNNTDVYLHSRMFRAALKQENMVNTDIVGIIESSEEVPFTFPLSPTLARKCLFTNKPNTANYEQLLTNFTCTENAILTGACCLRARLAKFIIFDQGSAKYNILLPYILISAVLSYAMPILVNVSVKDIPTAFSQLQLIKYDQADMKSLNNLYYNRSQVDYNIDRVLDSFIITTDYIGRIKVAHDQIPAVVSRSSHTYDSWFKKEHVSVSYYDDSGTSAEMGNWGDIVGPYIVSQLSKRKVVSMRRPMGRVFQVSVDDPVLATVGSILHNFILTTGMSNNIRPLLSWGSGVISDRLTFLPAMLGNSKPTFPQVCSRRPARYGNITILGVRGPLSRLHVLCYVGTMVPVIGDPASLMPKLYTPTAARSGGKSRVCLILHYIDARFAKKFPEDMKQVPIISNATGIPEQLAGCERVVSTALHGCIAAQAYGIPYAAIQVSDRISGGDWKYIDAHRSMGLYSFKSRHRIDPDNIPTTVDYFVQLVENTPQPRQATNYERLLMSFPLEVKDI